MGDRAGDQKHVLFVWKPNGYELQERDGDLPEVGSELEVDGRLERVTKVGVSPIPGDPRPCVFLIG